LIRVDFQQLQDVDLHFRVRLIQGQTFREQITADDSRAGLPVHDCLVLVRLPMVRLLTLIDLLEQMHMVGFLDPQEKMAL